MADVKNFSLKGVGNRIQFGKAGGHIEWDGTSFRLLGSTGSVLQRIKGASGVGQDDFVTVSQLQSQAGSGIEIRGYCRAATTLEISGDGADTTWVAGTNVNSGTKATFDDAPNTVDDVTLQVGDRVLVRMEGVSGLGTENPTIGANAARNGVYVVTSIANGTGPAGFTSTWVRASDMDNYDGTTYGEKTDVLWGSYVYVTEGTTHNNKSFILGRSVSENGAAADLGPVLDTADGKQAWLLFAAGDTVTDGANGGLDRVADEFFISKANTADLGGSTATNMFMMFDAATDLPKKKNIVDLWTENDVVRSTSFASGIVAKAADDSYYGANVLASAVSGKEGLSVAFNPAASSDIVIGLDINGLVAPLSALDGTEKVAVFDGGDGNRSATLNTVFSDLQVPNKIGTGAGFVFSNGAGTYSTGSVVASTLGNRLGITVVDGNTSSPKIGLAIDSLASVSSLELTDIVAVNKAAGSGENQKTTIQSIIDLVASNVTDNELGQGNSSVVVSDDDVDPGFIRFTVDGAQIGEFTATGLQVDSLKVDDLTSGRVVLAGVGGELVDNAGLTYSGSALSVTGTGTFTGQLSAASGVFTGTVSANQGDITTVNATDVNVTGTGTFASLVDQSLAVANGVVFAAAGNLNQDAGFTYDPTTDTLTVTNLNVTGSGGIDILDGQVAFGDATGNVQGSTAFTFNSGTSVLSVGNAVIQGTAATDTTITTSRTDGNLILAPNGAGEVIIQGAGNAEISAETGESLVLKGDGVTLATVAGAPMLEVTASAASANWIELSASASSADPVISVDGADTNIDLAFTLKGDGHLLVSNAGTYETTLPSNGLVTKQYVDNAIQTATVPGTQGSATVDIDLTANATVAVLAAASIPAAGYRVTRVALRIIAAGDSASTTVEVKQGSTVYMATGENDPTGVGIYISDSYLNAVTGTDLAYTVAAAGTVGSARLTVEYIVL